MNSSGIMIQLIKSVLTGESLNQQVISELQMQNHISNVNLYRLISSHSLANVVSVGLFTNGINVEGTPFEQAELRAAYSDAQIEAIMSSVRATFEAHQIAFIPLKGLVLKKFYPETSMRTCGDVDILVKEDELENAVKVLVEECGYRVESYNYHDVVLITPENQTVELHFSVLYDIERLDSVLSRVWDYAIMIDQKCEMKLRDDFFLFFILAHTFHHFVTSGCGIRFFMDLWVIRHRMGIGYDEKVQALCREAGIEKFAETAIKLSEVWFGNEQHDDLTLAMEEYVLTSGTFGNQENSLAASGTVKQSDRLKYNVKRMLLPYSKLKLIYPEMKPVQFPIYEVRRWGELLNRGLNRRRSMSEKSVSDEKKEKVRQLMEQLDIKQ